QAYLNTVIPSKQRATVLSFASLTGSAGGVVFQPTLGRVADVWSLGIGYVVAGALYVLQLPFLLKVRAMRLDADEVSPPDRKPADDPVHGV
ncbi:MAG: MFS transporter, partial [Acidimicrobiia bacterium]